MLKKVIYKPKLTAYQHRQPHSHKQDGWKFWFFSLYLIFLTNYSLTLFKVMYPLILNETY